MFKCLDLEWDLCMRIAQNFTTFAIIETDFLHPNFMMSMQWIFGVLDARKTVLLEVLNKVLSVPLSNYDRGPFQTSSVHHQP